MATILRVGFAMGGGVSLGTFCGGGLTQALKLLIVHGRDRKGRPFDRVVVDVFSGASAGALSLGAMLRYLLFQTDEQRARAAGELEAEFGDALRPLSTDAREDLIAAQVVQDLQRQLWTDEIKLAKLLPSGDDRGLRFKASLLDRAAVDDIARRHLVQWSGSGIRFDRRRLLADRVLYACTLANLTPMIADARGEFPGRDTGFIGLNDGMRSFTHRDIRVFDLNFARVSDPRDDRFPDRWCLYHDAPERKGLIGNLAKPETWAQIAATAIASGGFPFAFEPVVLPRKAFEYGPQLWCQTFGRSVPAKKSGFDGQESHPFSFVDGGTFNNEPIREAFRLASFIDGYVRAEAPREESQRLIIFVDPFVSEATGSFLVPVQRRWMLEDPNLFGSMDGYDLRRRASLDRLLPHVGTLLGAISNESRVNEGDGVFQVRQQFGLRRTIRRSLDQTLAQAASRETFQTLVEFCQARLDRADSDEVIPAGPLALAGELKRVIQEELEELEERLERDELDAAAKTKLGEERDILQKLWAGVDAFVGEERWDEAGDAGWWLRLLNYVAIDLVLGLEGKLERAQLVAIAPFKDLKRDGDPRGEAVTGGTAIDLPGGRLGGFAGFMSDLPDRIDYAAANRCAAEFLIACELIDPRTPLPDVASLELSPAEQRRFELEVEKGLGDLAKRVADMVRQSQLIRVAPGLDALLSPLIGRFIRNRVASIDWREAARLTVELRVTVPNQRFELDGTGMGDGDSAPVEDHPGGPWQLITLATFNWALQSWSGGFVKPGNVLDVDEDGIAFAPDRDFCTIDLPSKAQLTAARFSPNPTFVLALTKEDRGRTIPASRWGLENGVSPLETELLR